MENAPKLVNSHDNTAVTVNNSSFSIGRSLSCDHIIQSLGVSRFHCVIKKNDDKWTLYDRSTNGTVVNSTRYKFNECVDLTNGDVIKLGPENLDFVFTVDDKEIVNPDNIIEEAPSIFHNDEILEEAACLLAAGLEEPFESTQPSTSTKAEQPEAEPAPKQPSLNVVENELTCSICSEFFVTAVTLGCSHTYCKFCIDQWRKNKSTCPICRKKIETMARTLVLDNFIEKFLSTQNEDVQGARQALVKQREEASIGGASSSNVPSSSSDALEESVIELLSDDEDEDDDSDYDYLSDDHDYDSFDCGFYSRSFVRGSGYYGGYGRCYVCNEEGHWANTCPSRQRR